MVDRWSWRGREPVDGYMYGVVVQETTSNNKLKQLQWRFAAPAATSVRADLGGRGGEGGGKREGRQRALGSGLRCVLG